jgi:hypothetical protein
MWFVLSWLVACETTVPTVEVKEAVGAVDAVAPAPAENGRLTIASAPDRRGPLAPKVRSAPIPSGEVIVRDCYGDAERANNRPRPPQASRAPLPPKSAAAPKPAPSPAPTPALPAAPAAEVASNGPGADKDSSGAMAPSAGLGNTGGGKGGGGAKQDPAGRRAQEAAPVDLAAAAPAAPAAAPAAVSAEPHRGSAPQAEPPTPPPPQDLQGDALADGSVVGGVIETKKKAEKPRSDTDRETADEEATERARPREPVLDWGATVYLSNDDSMSLASAQRMLFSWMNGKHVTPAEVRPHELLNYFSFDTSPVGQGELFSALGSAEQEGDTLTVALAVQGAKPPRQPLDLTLVIDRSGSMQAEARMDYVRRGLTKMVDQLQDGDRVDLVLFDSSVCTPLQNFVVGRDDSSVAPLRDRPHAATGVHRPRRRTARGIPRPDRA